MENKENEPQPKNLSLCMEDNPKPSSLSRITQSAVKYPANKIRMFPMIIDFKKELQLLQEKKCEKRPIFKPQLEAADLNYEIGSGNSSDESFSPDFKEIAEDDFSRDENDTFSLTGKEGGEDNGFSADDKIVGEGFSLRNNVGNGLGDQRNSIENNLDKRSFKESSSVIKKLSHISENHKEREDERFSLGCKKLAEKNDFSFTHKKPAEENNVSFTRKKPVEENNVPFTHKKTAEENNVSFTYKKPAEENNFSLTHKKLAEENNVSVTHKKPDEENSFSLEHKNGNEDKNSILQCNENESDMSTFMNDLRSRYKSILESDEELDDTLSISTRDKGKPSSILNVKSNKNNLSSSGEIKMKTDYSSSLGFSKAEQMEKIPPNKIKMDSSSLGKPEQFETPKISQTRFLPSENYKNGLELPRSKLESESAHLKSKSEIDGPQLNKSSLKSGFESLIKPSRKSDEDLGVTPISKPSSSSCLKNTIHSSNEEFEVVHSSTHHKDSLPFSLKGKIENEKLQNKSNANSLLETKIKMNNSNSSSTSNKINQLETPKISPIFLNSKAENEMEKPWFTSNNHKSEMKMVDGNYQIQTPSSSSTRRNTGTESKSGIATPQLSSTQQKNSLKSKLQPITESSRKTNRKSDDNQNPTSISTPVSNSSSQNTMPRVQCSIDVSSFMKTRPPIRSKQAARKSDEEQPRVAKRSSGVTMSVSFKRLCVSNIDYIILKELGRGGSSFVYHCFDPKTETEYAIKSVDLNQDSNAVTGYINEVQTLQKLQHCKRVIKMYKYEILPEEKKMYVVLEKGGSDLHSILKDLTKRSEQLPLYIIIFYWVEMLRAVKEIHSNGVIHSDLKPANFLEAGGKMKLIDFGISSCVQQDNTSVILNVAMGTFNYISPEALCGNKSNNMMSPNFGKQKFKIGYKSDVWSLGCILYQLVYRKTPFQHIVHPGAKLCMISDPNHKIDFPEINNVPDSLIQTIKDCLQYNIKSRPSIDDLINSYGQFYC